MERWDDTYEHLEKEDPKMAYYLSMEYLQVRQRPRQSPCAESKPETPCTWRGSAPWCLLPPQR